MIVVLFIVGLVLLVVGAEVLVRGASRLAAAIGISPLVVGLTVVAFGTSSPEFAVSAQSAWAGQADIALGNVVGSNIFNVLLILGASALITPLVVSAQLVQREVPLMIAVSLLVLVLGWDGAIGRLEGVLLFAGIIAYTWFSIRESRRESRAVQEEYAQEFGDEAERRHPHWVLDVLMIVGGLAMLALGARWLVDGAVVFARAFGVSELLIGLTIIAAGTSLPEVATSLLAAIRGERDIAVGNVVGSNIFNILAVLGFAGMISPDPVAVAPSALAFDIPAMIGVAIACLPVFFTGHLISRWEGALFLAYYVGYVLYLILAATQDPLLPTFTAAMTLFVLPLTAITLAVW
ncbi:MAG TPA: calcium/sodium antiporter [Chloroflexota bacterium]|nr:calcium/sodium antiporter [Chloroflexota bacterium]